MNRRQLLMYTAGLASLSVLKPAAAEDFIDFSPELYAETLKNGEPFMLGFLSDW